MFGPWLLAQMARRQQPRGQKGNFVNSTETVEKQVGADKGESAKSSARNRLQVSAAKNVHASKANNRGSRFDVLADNTEMELDRDEATEEDGNEPKQTTVSTDDTGEVEVVLETQENEGDEGGVVKLVVSNADPTDHMRPLGSMKIDTYTSSPRTQGQSGGPRNKNEKTMKDITNRLEVRPTIAKSPKSISKLNMAQSFKDQRMLKRFGDVWRGDGINGPPAKSPYEKSSSCRLSNSDGLGQGKPPYPPDKSNIIEESPSPSVPHSTSTLGVEGTRTAAKSPTCEGDVEMESSSGEAKEMEDGRINQL